MNDLGWTLISSMFDTQRFSSDQMRGHHATVARVDTHLEPRHYLNLLRRQIRRRGPGYFTDVYEDPKWPDAIWQAGETSDPGRVTLFLALTRAENGTLVVGQTATPGWVTSDEKRRALGVHLTELVTATA